MSDYNDPYSDPTQAAILDWLDSQSRTTAGKPQYGATQLGNLTKLMSAVNNPLLGIMTGGYDPMTYVPQYNDQPAQVPFGATDYAVNAYKQRYGSNQTVQDLFNQADQGADQASLNALIDNADPNDVAQWGIDPQQAKDAINGYFNVKQDQAAAQAKYQYGQDAGGTGGSSGGGGMTGANGYGADGLPSKSNYFGIDPTLGSQLEQYVPPEVQQVQQNVMNDYMQRGQALANQQQQSAHNYDVQTNDMVGQAQGRGDAALTKFLADLNATRQVHADPNALPAGAGQVVQGQPYVDNMGISAHDPTEAANQQVDPGTFVKALAAANQRSDGQFNGYDVSGAQDYALAHGGQKASVRDLFDQFTPVGRQVGEVKSQRAGKRAKMYTQSGDSIMQDYANRAQKQASWVDQQSARRTGRPQETVLQHNLQSRLATLLSLGLG